MSGLDPGARRHFIQDCAQLVHVVRVRIRYAARIPGRLRLGGRHLAPAGVLFEQQDEPSSGATVPLCHSVTVPAGWCGGEQKSDGDSSNSRKKMLDIVCVRLCRSVVH